MAKHSAFAAAVVEYWLLNCLLAVAVAAAMVQKMFAVCYRTASHPALPSLYLDVAGGACVPCPMYPDQG